METFRHVESVKQNGTSRTERVMACRTSPIAAVGFSLLGAAITAVLFVAFNIPHATNSIACNYPQESFPIEHIKVESVQSAPTKFDDTDDGITSELTKFANEIIYYVAEEIEEMHLLKTSYRAAHREEQIVTDFLGKTNVVINSLLGKVGPDTTNVNLDICAHQCECQHYSEEGKTTSEGEKEAKERLRHASEPSDFGTHVADGMMDTGDSGAGIDGKENASSVTRDLIEKEEEGRGEDDGQHQVNARFAKLPTETCIRCCPKDKGGRRRTTAQAQVQDGTPTPDEGVDDRHREAWITPSWVQSCAICCDDDDDEPTTCPPVPAPAPCPTPPPTVSCPEPVPCPTVPPTPSPTSDTCIEPLEDLEDFTPECNSTLKRTYYRVRSFTIPEECEVFTDGPLVVESVNTTIQGSLIGTGQGRAGASGCNVVTTDGSSASSARCRSSELAAQGDGGGSSSDGGQPDTLDGGGGGGYGGMGGNSAFGTSGGTTYVDLLPGSGGGAGAASVRDGSTTSGSGGNGGGLVSIVSTNTFVLSANATINVDGDDGGDARAPFRNTRVGGGGGGSGGGVEIKACTAMIEGTISASGGRGGNGFDVDGEGGGGGGGGGGRIRIATETPSDVNLDSLIVDGGDGGSGGGGGQSGANGNSTVVWLLS